MSIANKLRTYWNGLQARSIALCVVLIVCTAGGLAAVLISRDYAASLEMTRRYALMHGNAIADVAEPAVQLNDQAALARILDSTEHHESVTTVRIWNAQGIVLAEHSEDHESASMSTCLPQPPEYLPIARETTHELRLVVPIHAAGEALTLDLLDGEPAAASDPSAPIGFVDITYSLDGVRAQIANRVMISAALAALIAALGVALTIMVVRTLLRPLHNLVETTAAIAGGDWSRRTTERAFGEFGDLARSFNHMTDRLHEALNSTEQKVRERTAELVRANHAKDDFLANMSHEIRTPMTAILGYIENLHDSGLVEADRQEALRTIERNGRHLLAIINDILDVSKIEAGQLQIERIEVPLIELICEVESLLRPRALEKGLQFNLYYDTPAPARILTDPTRLRQILINVIGNAIKFTQEGHVALHVALIRGDGQSRMRFRVIDTGIGIPADQLANVFHPFTQGDESMSRRFGGTGLGLTITERLVSLLGGEINVESSPGVGSAFEITIAAEFSADTPFFEPNGNGCILRRDERCTSDTRPPLPDAPLRCKVLLAEDGPDNQRLISFILRRAGAELTVAEHGQIALELVQEHAAKGTPFDIILMDMQMPVMDGYTATRTLRKQGVATPIVAVTAHAMSGDRERCIAAGCDDFATKPIDRAALIQIVRQYTACAAPESEALSAPNSG